MTVGRTDHHIDLEAVMVGVADPHTRRYCSPFDWSGDSSCTGGGMTVGTVDHHTASTIMMVGRDDHHKTPKSGAVDDEDPKSAVRSAPAFCHRQLEHCRASLTWEPSHR